MTILKTFKNYIVNFSKYELDDLFIVGNKIVNYRAYFEITSRKSRIKCILIGDTVSMGTFQGTTCLVT